MLNDIIRKELNVTMTFLLGESQSFLFTGTPGKLLLSFSIYSNASKIFNTKQPAGTLSSVNGIRFLSMTWVMLGHTYGFGAQLTGTFFQLLQSNKMN